MPWESGRTFVAGETLRVSADLDLEFVQKNANGRIWVRVTHLKTGNQFDVTVPRQHYEGLFRRDPHALSFMHRFIEHLPSGPPVVSETEAFLSFRLQPSPAQRRALTVLDRWAVWLPARVVKEDLGDYIEDINRRACEHQHGFWIFLRVISAMSWTTVNAIGYYREKVNKRKGA